MTTPATLDRVAAPPAPSGRSGSFYDRFLQTVERWPQNIAIEVQHSGEGKTTGVEIHTYDQLRTQAESIGRWLSEQGLEPGARCAILADNSARWVAAYLGTIAAGMIAVPFDTVFKPEQVATLLKDSGTSVLFADVKHLAAAERAVAGLRVRVVLLAHDAQHPELPLLDDMFAAGPGNVTPTAASVGDVAVLLYTSGTTSDPKGVMLTHDNLLAEMEAVFELIEVRPSDAILGVLPLFHALAQMGNLLLPFAAGARVVYLETLNTTELMRALREREITIFACVPQFFYLIHERILKQVEQRGALAGMGFRLLMAISRTARRLGWNAGKLLFGKAHEALGRKMRYLVTGGSRFDVAVGRDLHALGFDILQGYGLTETSGAAFFTPLERNVIGSVGPTMKGVEAHILDPQPDDEDGATPGSGEVLIRSRLVMKGYYKRPDATNASIQDGWLHTGDLGYFDEDGNLFITGRKKDVIVLSSGKNVYPEEIEAHYLKSQWIKELCVMGLEGRPGEPAAERLHAVLVPNFELLRAKKIVNAGEVIRFDLDTLSAELPSTKRILSYEIWQEDLPRTTTRKIKRGLVRKRVAEGQAAGPADASKPAARTFSAEDEAWLAEPDMERALRVIREAAREPREQIHPADNLELDLGLDSMERVELLVALEQELEASVDDAVVSQVYTVRELVDAVRAGRGGESKRPAFAGWEAIFATESDDPDVHAVARPSRFWTPFWYLVARAVHMFLRDSSGIQITGLEKLPKNGPFILSPNHQSFLDGPLLPAMMPWPIFRDSFYVGTSEIFGAGFWRALARTIKLIPVDPDTNLVPAMRAGAYGLRHGKILTLYPEGERSIDGTPKNFKKGAAILATQLKVPIVPVALEGFYQSWPRGKKFQGFKKLQVAIGDPIYPPQRFDNAEAAYTQLTAEVRARVVEMWEKLRGQQPAESEGRAEGAD
ncbi:MAG: AMP-binding protein [Terriglobales bacterium]